MANNFKVHDLIADNIYVSENNGNVVNTFGDQLIRGNKIFSGSNLFTGDSVSIETTGLNNFGLNSNENNFGSNSNQNNFGLSGIGNKYYSGEFFGDFTFDSIPKISGSVFVTDFVTTTRNQTISGQKTFVQIPKVSGYNCIIDNLDYIPTLTGNNLDTKNVFYGLNPYSKSDFIVNSFSDSVFFDEEDPQISQTIKIHNVGSQSWDVSYGSSPPSTLISVKPLTSASFYLYKSSTGSPLTIYNLIQSEIRYDQLGVLKDTEAVNALYDQTITGVKNFKSRPTVNGIAVLISGDNPSGFITGINNLVYTTGDQTISGIKTFTTGVNISGNVGIGTTTPTEKLDVIGSVSVDPSSGTYTLQNKNTSVLQSAFERARGWLVWSFNSLIGRLKTADITAAREWLLPNSSGTIPVTNLTTGSVSAEETFRTALYREMMWMGFRARRLFGPGPGAIFGTNSSGTGSANAAQAITGNVAIGSRAVGTWETGMSLQPGAGGSWRIPTSFSVSGGFSFLLLHYTSTSSNITSGSNTFLLNDGANVANNNFLVGNRIWNSNFPDGTRITTVVGQTITVDQNATSNGGVNSSIISCYDGTTRIVLGTTNNATTFNAQCCNAIATTNNMLASIGYASGATQITVSAPITYTASGIAGNTFITTTATPTGVVTGTIVSGNGIPANTIVTSVAGTQINLNTALAANVTSITVGFAPTMIAASNIAMGPAVYIASGTGGNNFITLTTTPIGFSSGYIVSGSGITPGTTITSIVGNQVNLSTTLAANVSNIAVTFMQSSAVLAHAYAYGIPDNTRISSITSSTTNSNIIINLNAAVTGSARYGTGLVGQVGTPLVYQSGFSNTFVNNAIFIELKPNPSTGKVEIRIGYQRTGRMFYSSFAQMPEGEYTNWIAYSQFILDYSSATNTLRLWANRASFLDTTTVPARPLQSNVLLSLATPSDLVTNNTNVYWGVQSCDDGVRAPFSATMCSMTWRDAMYYPFTLAE